MISTLSKFKLFFFLLFFLLFKPYYVFSDTYTDKFYGDTLRIGEIFKPSIINPILTHSSISALLKGIIFDGLIKLNDKMESDPHLAISWENSSNGLTWIFHLRRGVTFHDGVELTAKDVKFTFDKINDPSVNSPFNSIFKNFESVNVKNRYTVEIHLKSPLPSLLFYLDVGILPMHLLRGEDILKSQFNYQPIGTGPFKLQHWSQNEIVLKANKDYFGGKSHIETVVVKIFQDQSIAWAELMKGNIDCVFLAYLKDYDIMERITDLKVYSFLNIYYYILAFDGNNVYFGHRKIRQALNYAIDKEKVLTNVLRRKGRVSCGTIYPQSWAYDNTIEPYPYDPKKALDLLNNEGWKDSNGNHILDKNGREFEFDLLIVKGDDVSWKSASLIQQQLLDIGIRMRVNPLSFPTYENSLLKKKFDAALLSIISDDPDRNFAWWHSSQIDRGFNVFSYRNKKVDDLLNKGRITLDREERKGIYYQFQREIYDDPPGVFLFWKDYLIGIHKRFRGVRFSPVRILNHINEWYVPEEEQKYR